MICRLVLAAVALAVIASPARADDPPDRKDAAIVHACLKKEGGPNGNQELCIKTAYRPCIGPDEDAKSPAELMDCLRREQLVWDQILNDSFRSLRDGLEPEQRLKLRDMQRAWLDMRDKTCAFYYDFYQGTMANPMIASCVNRETARRAIFLLGFADEMASWIKNRR